MAVPPLDCSVLIVTYCSAADLPLCLDSVRRATHVASYEILVVDNASTDGTAALALADSGVRLIANRQNVGFSRANNQGFREARGRYVLLLNPDAQVSDGAIDRMVAFLDAHPDVGIAGGRVNSPDGTLQRASRRSIPTPMVSLFRLAGLSRLFPNHPAARAYNLEDTDPSATMDVGAVMGAFLMVRREAIEKTGGMDERYFLYGEDIDFCMAVRAAGWRVVYYPEAVVTHRKGASSRQSRLRANREFHRSMVLFHDKHFAATTPGWANVLIRSAIAARGTAFDLALRLGLIR